MKRLAVGVRGAMANGQGLRGRGGWSTVVAKAALVGALALGGAACGGGGATTGESGRGTAAASMETAGGDGLSATDGLTVDGTAMPDGTVTPDESVTPDGMGPGDAVTGDGGGDGGGGDDAVEPCEGCLLAPCETNEDCNSGWCVEGPAGQDVCTKVCSDACPEGFSCKPMGGGGSDTTFLCLYDHISYCRPCEADTDCANPLYTGADNRCVDGGDGSGSFCATACPTGWCPDGATCVTETLAGDEIAVCEPKGGAECGCTGRFVEEAATTTCSETNELGTCQGERVCNPDGLSACSASTPAEEICNDVDDDCDGETDEGFADKGQPCDGEDADLCEDGVFVCGADGSLVCDDDADSKFELCNELDDDCDGETDEDYPDKGSACDGSDEDLCADGVWVCSAGALVCDDDEASAVEVCNGLDDDCDGDTDEDFTLKGWACDGDDADQCEDGVYVCDADGGLVCDDDPASAEEICNGVDDDCDGVIPDDEADADGDGMRVCEGDCDDLIGTTYDGAPEFCDGVDNDCNGATDELFKVGGSISYTDLDGTAGLGLGEPCGASGSACDGGVVICADNKTALTCSTASLAGDETCNGVDDDCDGVVDDDWGPGGTVTFTDTDGTTGLVLGDSCGLGACAGGVVVCAGDGATLACSTTAEGSEICDDVDNDCDGVTDEGCDDDGDGYCDAGMTTEGTPASCPLGGGDCADDDGAINPGAAEVCDDVDNNCEAGVDEGCDDDGDGYCDANMGLVGTPSVCPNGGGDCNDGNEAVNPVATEICDDVDNDCKQGVDDGCDDDDDGYCDAGMVMQGTPSVCPNGGGDCKDDIAGIHPGVTEVCDDVDNNCSQGVDEGCDDDKDGYCDANMIVLGSPTVCSNGAGDCDDGVTAVNPGATEICDDVDNNCAQGVDEGCDDDDDDYCDAAMTVAGVPDTCGHGGGDCDDGNAAVHPGASEVCNGVDDDCQGGVDDGLTPPPNTNQLGACAGTTKTCTGAGGWVDDYSGVPNYGGFDVPDVNGTDDDCDGVDGDVDTAIFVDLYKGNDSNPGTMAQPKRHIQAGIDAQEAGFHVIVGNRTYSESLTLKNGVSVYGGYDATASWVRTTARAVVHGGTTAITAHDLYSTTVLDSLSVAAASATAPGASSYGLHAVNASGLQLSRVDITAGNGAPGQDGAAGSTGSSGSAGSAGQHGGDGTSNYGYGGGGGSGCGGNKGGTGGRGGYGNQTGYTGYPGVGPNYGGGGLVASGGIRAGGTAVTMPGPATSVGLGGVAPTAPTAPRVAARAACPVTTGPPPTGPLARTAPPARAAAVAAAAAARTVPTMTAGLAAAAAAAAGAGAPRGPGGAAAVGASRCSC